MAAPVASPPVDEPTGSQRTPVRRSVGLGVTVGLAVSMATIGVVYSIIAIPFYVLAQSESSGLDRPLIRHALVNWGIPVCLALGVACGAVVGVWYGRGGRLPTDRTPEEYQ